MVLGEKLWEGKGKSVGPSFIKSVGANGVTSEFAWMAQVKGMGRAKGADLMINVTAVSMLPPKGVAGTKDLGMFNTMTGDMGTMMGMDLMKMVMGKNPSAVGLWTFMTMSEKLGWMNDVIAVAVIDALDPMWMEFNLTIYEWK
jgi:hypothetical protein